MSKAITPADRKDKLTRTERKDLTRSSLMQAALALMGEGRSFTSLGIREIAREAGMVPNGFYRHFRSTDDLGLALVEEVGITLRRLLREVRQNGVEQSEMTRRSVQVYHQYVVRNRLLFLFISTTKWRKIFGAWASTKKCPPPTCKWCAASSSPPCLRPRRKYWICHPDNRYWKPK